MRATTLTIREATVDDVPSIVQLLADDPLGSKREDDSDPPPIEYYDAFFSIDRDVNHILVVATQNCSVVGTLQLSFLPYLTYKGGRRGQIEAVRVARDARGSGVGRQLIEWAIAQARVAGCHLVQLTTDAGRREAHGFYEQLGFEATHTGFKLHLSASAPAATRI